MLEKERIEREHLLRKAVLAGDESAWQSLYDGAYTSLERYIAWRCGGAARHVEEVTQDTWLHAVRKIASFDPGRASFASWLRGIAANLLRNRFRRDRLRRGIDFVVKNLCGIRARNEGEGEGKGERIVAALAALPAHYEEVLRAKYLDGLSVAAIALEMGQNAKAVESLLTRARTSFRAAYQALE